MQHKISSMILLSMLALVVLPYGKASAQSLTAEEVTAVMESQAVKGGFDSCAASYPHAENISLILLIEADGQASLTKTDPAVEANLLVCFQTAAKNIKLKATGKKFEITYPMQLAPSTTPAPQPAAGAGGIVVLPSTPTQAQPAPQPVAVTAAAKPAPDPYWHREYKKGLGITIAGAVILPVGGVMFIGSLIGIAYYSLAYSLACGLTSAMFGGSGCETRVPAVLPVLLFTGLAFIITGVVLLAVGSVKKNRAYSRMYSSAFIPQFGISPTADGEGAFAALKWQF